MADNKKFLEFYRLLENYKKLKKDQSVYKLSEEEIKKINSIVYDFTLNFKTEKSPLGFGLGALTGKAEDLANMERWSKGLVKALGLDNLDMTNPEDIKKAQAYLGHAIETTKGEEYAEQITGKGIKPNETDTELEDMMEDRSFNEFNLFRINKIPVRTKGGFGVDNIVRKLKTEENKEFLQFFKKKGKIDLTDEKSLVNLLSELTPDLKKEYITTGNINIDNAVKNIEKQEFSHPNLDITLEQITERFQGGDPTIPLNIDAINALDVKPAIDLIINNKLPLTDEAKAELDKMLKFQPEEYRNNFRSIYFPEEEVISEELIDIKDSPVDDSNIGENVIDDTEIIEESVSETPPEDPPLTNLQKAGQVGKSLLQGADKLLDYIGGPGAIVSYIMGRKGLKEAMKEVKPQASAELSPMFMQHLRQTKELAKRGFHPEQARKIQKGIDNAYQRGLENAVRGTAGDRAKYLAQSGILDAKRSSALLDFAAKDSELQKANEDKYQKLMMFKENFDITQTEKERTEDMKRQEMNKKAAANFTSAAFSNLLSGFGRSSLTDKLTGNRKDFNLYNHTDQYLKSLNQNKN